MENLKAKILEKLEGFDKSDSPFSESAISEALNSFDVGNFDELDNDIKLILRAESMAFRFMPSSDNSYHGWGTYFGPLSVLKNEDGQFMESPSIQLVTPEIIAYWEEKAKTAMNPILKYRYADLVWDFSKTVTGNPPAILMAHISIDAILDLIQKNFFEHTINAIKKLKRALSISLSVNDTLRIIAVRDSMIQFEDKIATDDKPGLWGFCFDELIENSKIPVEEHQFKKIISDLEQRLNRTSDSNSENFHPYSAEHAAMRLARYYQKENRIEDKKRVLKIYGNGLIASLDISNALAGSAQLHKLYELYYANGMREDADALTTKMKEFNEKSAESMSAISHEFSLPKEQTEKFLEEFSKESLEVALLKLAREFLPSKEEVIKQVKETASEAPLFSLIPFTIQDEKGRRVATVGGVNDDLDGRVAMQISQLMQIEAPILHLAIDRIMQREDFSFEALQEHLWKSPLFSKEQEEIISKGLQTYFQGDYFSSAHILIPMVENMLRNIMRIQNFPIYKPSRGGGLSLKTLDEILRNEEMTRVLGENVPFYLRVVLSDQRGWNLRNSICHGMLSSDKFQKGLVDRIFHIIVLLAQLRAQKK